MAAAKTTAKKGTVRRKERKNIERGAAHIQSTVNNTIVTITRPLRLMTLHFSQIFFTEGLTFIKNTSFRVLTRFV